MFQTTRRRLAFWYAAVTAILLLLFATGVYLYVRFTLVERVDDTLNHVVEVVQRSLVIEPANLHQEGGSLRVNITASFRDNAATDEDDHIDLEWFSPRGELLWSTLSEPLNLPLDPNNCGKTVHIERQGFPIFRSTTGLSQSLPPTALDPLVLRQVTHRVEVGRQLLGYLRVSHPWFEVTTPSRELFIDLVLGIVVMVGTVGAVGWFLSGLAMEPVRDSYQRLKQFTADASHELRNPIAVIQTNVQVALADPEPEPLRQQHHLRVVERLTRRLGRLVDDLLFLARQDSGTTQNHWSSVDLHPLLTEVLEEQSTLATEKGIVLQFTGVSAQTRESWILPQADRDQLARLLTNLVGNAVQYTPTGGTVTVQVQRLGRSGNSTMQITVKDTGIGISPEALPHLFDRFYRVDPSRSQTAGAGSGLGLAIAQAIVENHRGQIQIDSSPGAGTTVTVTLPPIEPKS